MKASCHSQPNARRLLIGFSATVHVDRMTPMLDRAGSDRLDSIHPAAANADGYGFDDDMMRLKVAMRDVPFGPGHGTSLDN